MIVMHIWCSEKWKKVYYSDKVKMRSGLRLIFDKDADPEVRRACKEFCKWLRKEYSFPIRIPIYFKSTIQIKARNGEMFSAIFFAPYNRFYEPYIKISTGDYYEMLKERGKDNALGAILCSIAHELTHYFQWINDIKFTEIGEERQAKAYVNFIMDEYKDTREHP